MVWSGSGDAAALPYSVCLKEPSSPLKGGSSEDVSAPHNQHGSTRCLLAAGWAVWSGAGTQSQAPREQPTGRAAPLGALVSVQRQAGTWAEETGKGCLGSALCGYTVGTGQPHCTMWIPRKQARVSRMDMSSRASLWVVPSTHMSVLYPTVREVGPLHLGSLEFLFGAYFPLPVGAWSGDLAKGKASSTLTSVVGRGHPERLPLSR